MTDQAVPRRGFTLIEMLVVIAIFAVLTGMILPAVQKLRDAANLARCRHNLGQIGVALHQYHDSQGSFPSGYLCQADPNDGLHTAPGWGWAALLLPQLGQDALHRHIDMAEPVEADPRHQPVRTMVLKSFVCPADRHTGVYQVVTQAGRPLTLAATSSYAACFGSGGVLSDRPDAGTGLFFRNSAISIREVVDGLGHTLAIGERASLFTRTPWAGAIQGGSVRVTPGSLTVSTLIEEGPAQVLAQVWPRGNYALNSAHSDPTDFFSPHAMLVHFAFADGSARPVKTTTSVATVLRALATRAGGEEFRRDDF